MARAIIPLNINAFLEKAKMKDDGSKYTDWVRNLRIILIAAHKSYSWKHHSVTNPLQEPRQML